MLTGIRPSKLFRGFAERYGEEKAKKIFTDDYFVSKQKTGLTASVASAEEKTIALSRPDSFSLYVAIPFCPSRCSYCSFSIEIPSARCCAVSEDRIRIHRKHSVQRKQFPSMLSSYVRSFA